MISRCVNHTSLPVILGLCLLICLAVVPALHAESYTVGVYGTGAYPQGDFGDEVEDAMPCFDVQGFYRIPGSLFSIGIEAGYLHYGNEHRTAPLSDTIPDVQVRVSRNNQILRAGLVLRYEYRIGCLIPHVDGMIGLHHLWTSTNAEDRYTHDEMISSTTLRDTAFAGGIGGGFLWEIHRNDEKGYSVAIDTAIRYTSGGEATYLTRGDVTIDAQNEVHLNKHTTRTDLMDVRIGVVIGF